MTVASDVAAPPRNDYVEDGVTVLHAILFQFFHAAEISVTRILADGTKIALVQPTHYSVAGGAGSTGSITKIAGGVAGATIRIDRNTVRSQLAEFVVDRFDPAVVEEALDRLVMIAQEIRRDLILRDQLTDIIAAILVAGDGISFEVDAEGGTITINNTLADPDILAAAIGDILIAGLGIELTVAAGTVTITNTVSGAGSQDCLLLASGVGDGSTGAEDVRDIIGVALQGLGCTITVNDGANTITVDLTDGVTAELIRDTIAAALVAGSGIAITVNDLLNTITIAVDDERIRDAIGTCLVAGAGITIAVDDGANTITISATGLDATYKGIVPTDRAGAFDFTNAMNGRATNWTGGAASATIRDEADSALDAGWTHVVWVGPGHGPLVIHRDTSVTLYVNGAVVSAEATIIAGGQATIHRKAADDFTIVGVKVS